MSWMQDVRDGNVRKRRQDGIPTGFKVIAIVWGALCLGLALTLVWVATHFIVKYW
jgi:hypothetical protein